MTDQDVFAVLSGDALALVEELHTVRDDAKRLKAREEQIRTDLLIELKGVEFGVTASGETAIVVQRQPRTRVDSKRLQALYEEVWEDCQIASEVEVLRFPESAAE